MKIKIQFLLTFSMLTIFLSSCLSTKLTRVDDKFTGETTFYSSTLTGFLTATIPAAIVVSKTIKSNGENIFIINLNAESSILNTDCEGVIILFTDGSKLQFPNAKIDVSSGSGANWSYRSNIVINEEQVDLFVKKKVDAIRLYLYDRHLLETERENLPIIFKKMINAQ